VGAPDHRCAPAEPAAPAAPTGPVASQPATSEPPATPERPRFIPTAGPAGSDERPERAAASVTTPPTAVAAAAQPEAPGNADARMTPAVRRLLREHGLTAAQIVGTGGGGRLTREDVTKHREAQRTGQPGGGQSVGRP